MVLLGESNASQAVTVAERIRRQLKREVFSDGTAAAAITASFGVAAAPAPGLRAPNELIERVEAVLEEAKRGGRDRFAMDPAVLATPPSGVEFEEQRRPLPGQPEPRPIRHTAPGQEPTNA